MLSRRNFLKGLPLSILPSINFAARKENPVVEDVGPVDFSPKPLRHFIPDGSKESHAALWSSEPLPPPKTVESRRLVVIGGGLAGLSTAVLLQEFDPVVLEIAPRFGGNSQGESWKGVEYTLGAAYLCPPEGETLSLLSKIGVSKKNAVIRGPLETVHQGSKLNSHFWKGPSDPYLISKYRKTRSYLEEIQQSKTLFPNIPCRNDTDLARVKALDSETLLGHLEKELGTLPYSVKAFIEEYCWSALGASAREVSAAAGLNFLASEMAAMWVFPGGNSYITEAMYRKLETHSSKKTVGAKSSSLRAKSAVKQVEVKGGHVEVTYLDAEGMVRRIDSEAVVMACPKFIAKKLLVSIEPERLKAIEALSYRAYLVANCWSTARPSSEIYDLYLLPENEVDFSNPESASSSVGASDLLVNSFAKVTASGGKETVLSLFRAFPFEGARSEILSESAFEKYQTLLRSQAEKLLPALGMAQTSLQEIRVKRWGHAMPLAKAGIYSNDTLSKIQAPFKERVFFVQQDNWCLPAFETATQEALYWAPRIRKLLA